jgi:hypothetical protein
MLLLIKQVFPSQAASPLFSAPASPRLPVFDLLHPRAQISDRKQRRCTEIDGHLHACQLQWNFQVPPERLLAQLSTVRVTRHGSSGKADSVDYPGVGGFFSDAQGNAVAVHFADGSALTPQNPARAGELIAEYGTGFGSTYPPKPIGFPAPAKPPFQGTMHFTEPNTSYTLDMPAQQ